MIKKILVATDGSVAANHAVRFACQEAKAHGASLTILHAVGCDEMWLRSVATPRTFQTPPADYPISGEPFREAAFEASPERVKEAEEAMEKANAITREMEVEVETKILYADPKRYCFDPKRLIVMYAQEGGFDAVVLGSHGKTGISKVVLGSVSEYVVKNARCPVLLIK